MHRILSDRLRGVEAVYGFGKTESEYLESLIVLVKIEHNEDGLSVGTEPIGGFHRHDFVCTVKAQFFVEPFRRRNGAKQALGRSVEVVGDDVLGAVLKVWDGGIFRDRQLRCLERRQCREGHDNDCRECAWPRSSRTSCHLLLVHWPMEAVKEKKGRQLSAVSLQYTSSSL
ncbi:MAG: hypothetical protein E8D47_07185 [Nitrospira sp.]|nr:MAG: hypothetical protein E8D47_07185 [Nitrospira sp.]